MISTRQIVVFVLLYVLSGYFCELSAQPNLEGKQDLERFVREVEQFRGLTQATSSSESGNKGKCGLGAWFTAQQHWNSFSQAQQNRLKAAFDVPVRQKDRIIGHFRIFYDTTGPNAPALVDPSFNPIGGTVEQYVDSVGKFFNYAWIYEIDSLGYTSPPVAADGEYWVFITDFGIGVYGQTTPDSNPVNDAPPYRYKTYIEVDNDFSEDWFGTSRGIPGLRVTSAHEFHHAIQIGSYGTWWSDIYFYEITSTWMEDVVHPDVNDYYQSLTNDPSASSQFSHPERRFTLSDSGIQYSRAIWGKYIEKRYSRNLMRRTWEYMRQVPSIQALDNALSEQGSSFRSAFLEFSYWNFFTGEHADSVKYYTDARHYPSMIERPERAYSPPALTFDNSLEAISSQYQPIRLTTGNMLTIISNINIASEYSPFPFTFSYSLSSDESQEAKHLSNGLFSMIFNVTDPENWTSQDTIPTVVSDVVVFPNPFIPKGNKPLKFHLPQTNKTVATVTILSSSLGRFFSGELPIQPFEPIIEWDGHDEHRNVIPSGVYVVIIDMDGKQYVGKFGVIR